MGEGKKDRRRSAEEEPQKSIRFYKGRSEAFEAVQESSATSVAATTM
jgi:hypothetical protein